MNPNPISDSDVRMTDINVRSALMRVRWKLIPVRRDDSSTEMSSEGDVRETCGLSLIRSLLAAAD